jgi:dihydropteroate synthase-like protein
VTELRVLVVTGALAEAEVRRHTEGLSHKVDVHALPVSVAAFITPGYAAKQLGGLNLDGYDMILLPGSVNGDVSPVEQATGVPTFKGPIHAADLPLVIRDDLELSRTEPADEQVMGVIQSRALEDIEEVEREWRRVLSDRGGLVLGSRGWRLPVGPGFPMRVAAEIVNAPLLDPVEVTKRAAYYESMGADIIDIGMLARDPKPESIQGIVEAVRRATDMPISIDSLEPAEILAALDLGVDLVLSLDAGNIEEVAPMLGDAAAVVLPTNMREGVLPRNACERVEMMSVNMALAREHGAEKIIADLVVEPLLRPGLMEALKAYQLFHAEEPRTPILFGLGNVSELIDADSTGVIAAVSALAAEVGADMLHVPEYSVKNRGGVREAVEASRMMFLAERRGTLPKDLGVDLLVLKEKRWVEEAIKDYPEAEKIQGTPENGFSPDRKGWFRIAVDRERAEIAAIHYPPGEEEPDIVVKGRDSRTIYQTIIRRELVSKLDHAAYLGKELEKAHIALVLGRSYVQERPLFNGLSPP